MKVSTQHFYPQGPHSTKLLRARPGLREEYNFVFGYNVSRSTMSLFSHILTASLIACDTEVPKSVLSFVIAS